MATDVLMPVYRLYLNGVQAPEWIYRHITKVKFEEFEEDGSTSALTLYIDDPEMQVMDANIFVEKITIIQLMIGWIDDYYNIFEGMVEVIEQDYPSSGRITLNVMAKDVTYKMTRKDINKAYKGLTYSDIVKQIAGKYGLIPDVDDTTYIYDPSLKAGDIINQSGKSDLDFVRYLAEEIGFVFYVDSSSKKLIFKKPSNWTSDNVVEVSYKCDDRLLLSFRPKFNDYDKDKEVQAANVDSTDNSKTGETVGSESGSGSGAQEYTVKSGDCLWSIAKWKYGSGAEFKKIYEANKDKIKMPGYVIYAGQQFTLP